MSFEDLFMPKQPGNVIPFPGTPQRQYDGAVRMPLLEPTEDEILTQQLRKLLKEL